MKKYGMGISMLLIDVGESSEIGFRKEFYVVERFYIEKSLCLFD